MMVKLEALLFILGLSLSAGVDISLSEESIEVEISKTKDVSITFSGSTQGVLTPYVKHDVVTFSPSSLPIASNQLVYTLSVTGVNPGHDVINFNYSSPNVDTNDVYIHVTVGKSNTASLVSTIIGWVYFVAWSVSFYPQIYENWRRKSVVGLNFDFLALNFMGHTLYAIFNCCLYWIPEVESEYFNRYPKGLNPVQINDIFFSVHASIVSFLTVLQCFCYERAGQTVSRLARVILTLFFLTLIVTLILSISSVMIWLDFLYTCSYIKLAITLIKYIPQAIMNYKRKSTAGWSIGNVILDFTGGLLSMLQMIINADNYNDWASIFGDPTKFGLGLFSVLFDILFIIQHYILYRNVTGKEYDLSFQT